MPDCKALQPWRLDLRERTAVIAEAEGRGTVVEFLDLDSGEGLAVVGDPSTDDRHVILLDDTGLIAVTSLQTGRTLCRETTVVGALEAWRRSG